MTIITKTSSAKKEDVGVLPLFQSQPHNQSPHDGGLPIIVTERRVNYPCRAVFILILVALTVLTLGIIGSSILARFYGNQHTERLRFHCRLPYRSEDLNRQVMLDFNNLQDSSDSDSHEIQLANTLGWMREFAHRIAGSMENDDYTNSDEDDSDSSSQDDGLSAQQLLAKFFTENVDMNMGEHADDEGVTKIDVPDFKEGRVGRFVHDFLYNQTAIVDMDTKRCFMMPLDREKIMTPTSFREMMMNVYNGKYALDMKVIQENMRVVLPALKDFSEVSPRILQECNPSTMRLYRLEKFVHGVVRRSAELDTDAKFGVFAGKMLQYDLHNMHEVARFEELDV